MLKRQERKKEQPRANTRKKGNVWAHKRETNGPRERERENHKGKKKKTLNTGGISMGHRNSTG
jgi:hypothetical protein